MQGMQMGEWVIKIILMRFAYFYATFLEVYLNFQNEFLEKLKDAWRILVYKLFLKFLWKKNNWFVWQLFVFPIEVLYKFS